MSYNHHLPTKVEFKPKRKHGMYAVIFFLGWLLPPLAVAARFGIGKDFFINVILTACGYFPGHGHNFYVQNIRNNATKARTPKWAIRYGLVDTSDIDRRAKKSQWAKRYDERLPESTLVGQQLADGEEGPDYTPHDERNDERLRNEGLWTRDDDVEYYNEDEAPNQRKWHYPANFEGTVGDGRSKRRQKDTGGDRWERTRQARSSVDSGSAGAGAGSGSYGTYPPRAATDDDVPEWGRDYGSKGRRSSKSNKKGNASTAYNNNNSSSHNNGSAYTDDSSSYSGNNNQAAAAKKPSSPDDVFSHEF